MKTLLRQSILISTLVLFSLSNGANAQTVTDIDGNVYNTVTIGSQTWMKENLKVTKYRSGDAIATTTSTSIPNDSTSKYQWAFNDDNNNAAIYGRLYTWYAATDYRNVCPLGWHVPTDAEWTTLTNYLGGESEAGGKMKEIGTTHWASPNTGANDSSGFSAVPGAARYTSSLFSAIGYSAHFWSATTSSSLKGFYRDMYYNGKSANRGSNNKSDGFSVRCLKDSLGTRIIELIDDSPIKFIPNPSNGKFKIVNTALTKDVINIIIYNVKGVIVLQAQNPNEINLSEFSKGFYFVKITDGEKIYNQKIVVE